MDVLLSWQALARDIPWSHQLNLPWMRKLSLR
jgi:hypothetical protein